MKHGGDLFKTPVKVRYIMEVNTFFSPFTAFLTQSITVTQVHDFTSTPVGWKS